MLWNYVAELDGPGGARGGGPGIGRAILPFDRRSGVAEAVMLADVDRDGTPDVVAMLAFPESSTESERQLSEAGTSSALIQQVLYKRVAVALSGRSGLRLWARPIDQDFDTVPAEPERRLSIVARGRSAPLIAFLDGTQWSGLEPATGQVQAGPIDLSFVPVRPVQHGDLDGDGEAEIVALGPGSKPTLNTLHAFSIKTGRELWFANVGAAYGETTGRFIASRLGIWDETPFPECPLVEDLDGDGRSEIVVPDAAAMPPLSGYRGVRLIDGTSGATRWERPMRPETRNDDGVAHIVAAPDLDGDGTRDVIAVSRYDGPHSFSGSRAQPDEPARVYLDALSGKDGRQLWWWHVDLPMGRTTRIGAPAWWGRGPDGWPLLALPLGFGEDDQGFELDRTQFIFPPVVHLIEASTGTRRHTVLGLERARFADLNGDGLVDLWGEIDGELRAFRGEAPEVWRALGRFAPAGTFDAEAESIASRVVDFDADGVADVLIGGVIAPGEWRHESTGSHTAMARSGRDGHLIWKTQIDPRGSWFDPNGGDEYDVSAFPLPAGDLDGDGTADVIVKKSPGPLSSSSEPSTSPIELLSGRTGARLWLANVPGFDVHLPDYVELDWTEPRVILPNGTPDLIALRSGQNGCKLARISGREGRVLWDVAASTGDPGSLLHVKPPHAFDDLDGDGGLDVMTVIPQVKQDGTSEYTLLAVSLRDGKRLWSQPVRFRFDIESIGGLCVGDVDGDKSPDVVVLEAADENEKDELTIRLLNGRDGKVRWTWKSGAFQRMGRGWHSITLADFDGHGTPSVCIGFSAPRMFTDWHRFVVLDGAGKERVRREIIGAPSALKAVDVNGDGRDELLVVEGGVPGGRLCAWSGELKDLWTWPARPKATERKDSVSPDLELRNDRLTTIDRFLPAAAGRAGAVVITPALAIDVGSARPLWTGQAPLASSHALENLLYLGGSSHRFGSPFQFAPGLLDPGDATRLPLLIGNGLGATVCREAMPTTAEGAIAAPRGRLMVPGKARFDLAARPGRCPGAAG